MPNKTDGMWEQSGWATYAAIMLFGGGLVGIVNGVWALRYTGPDADLVLAEKNLDAWGSVAVLGGVLLIAVGIGVFYGKKWARWTGIALALLTIIWSAGWAAFQPMQSLIGVLIFMSVVFSLAMHPVTVERGP